MIRMLPILVVTGWLIAADSIPSARAAEGRRVLCLDGTWQIAEGSFEKMPPQFDRRVPVPGLADMAEPAFADVGKKEGEKLRQAFWYRRTFTLDGPLPAVARLKIHKARYGTRVYLNGKLVGDHLPCFTPALIDVRQQLRGDGQTNELVIRVGAWREAVPRSIPDGWDFEKIRYIPGIYDSVELILSGTPHIVNVQAVPDLDNKAVRVVAEVASAGKPGPVTVRCRVSEAAGGKVVGSVGPAVRLQVEAGKTWKVEVTVPIAGCRLWSPEDPFLYRLEVKTAGDVATVRFGMRTFGFDPKTKQALLNGKPYALRGTNVCIYRFFEDPARGDRPWREEWVRRLHKVFRDMHWNSARYCIGFPPEKWYDMADEEGVLIQDEFPIWYLGQWPKELQSDELIKEYSAWMRERWNHPCVVIWDAQNETQTAETGKAIQAVRGLDLSGRPWDNGWSPPQAATDVFEAHPYPFYSAAGPQGKPSSFRLRDFANKPGAPGVPGGIGAGALRNTGNNPVVINEYGWLWLNRDGTPTTLTEKNYQALLGPSATAQQRRHLYARYLAAKTEFWRCRRQVAGVLHFCGLGYSRPGGQTSDHFLDIERLTLEPDFRKYVRDSFAPVGLMVDYWAEQFPAAEKCKVPVVVVNDLGATWEGTVRLRVVRGEQTLWEGSQPCKVGPVGSETLSFEVPVPKEPGIYNLVAELTGSGQERVQSWRDVTVAAL
jgi:hypothetical protein